MVLYQSQAQHIQTPTTHSKTCAGVGRLLGFIASLVATILIAGCAYPTPAKDQKSSQNTTKTNEYNGRISLQILSEPRQSFTGGFALLGNAQDGEMTLVTPLGNIAAVLRWQPGFAQLDSGGQKRQYPSVESMIEATTGAAIPLQALFAWLQGQQANAPGWRADTSRIEEGRISAQRSSPLPEAQLRIVLDQ